MQAWIRAASAVFVAAWALGICGRTVTAVDFAAGAGGQFGQGAAPRNILAKMGREIDAIVAENKKRGTDLMGKRSGGAGNLNFTKVLEFTTSPGSTPMDKSAMLKRISKAFVADMQRESQATLGLAIADQGGLSRMVTLKYPDRIVSLVDEGGTWTLMVAKTKGKAVHEGMVEDHDAGNDVPGAHRQDFVEAANLLSTLTDDALPSKKLGRGPAGRGVLPPAAGK